MKYPGPISLNRSLIGGIAGGIFAAVLFWILHNPSMLKWIVLGVGCGVLVGTLWPVCHSFIIRLKVEDWRLEEIEIQGLKFTTAGMQRRVAWRLFVEMATRISTQPLSDEEGDDGV